MELYKRVCKNPYCCKEFMGTRNQRYCKPECRVRQRKIKPKKVSTINEVAKEAKENGISYGKYVAMQYIEEQRERMKK